MAGLVDVPSTAKAVRDFAESLGVKINATGFAFLILVCGGLYIYYYAYSHAVEPVAGLSTKVAALEERVTAQQTSIGQSLAAEADRDAKLEQSIKETANAFSKLRTRLEEIEDGYWIRPTISSSDENTNRSSTILPISHDDDVLMQVFLPRGYKVISEDGAYIRGISLAVNGEPVPLAAYTRKFPKALPKEVLNPTGGFQEIELSFDKAQISDPQVINSVGMLFVIKRVMILSPATDDDLATFAD
jgi:hypothetical protein